MQAKKIWIFGFALVLSFAAYADEGMWQLSQIRDLNPKKLGLEITAEEIYSPDKTSISNAIVWLGGCSASFVSADGLILTNHHCAYGALQRVSAQDSIDYITKGFLAKDRSQELPAVGEEAYVLMRVRDVTKEIEASVKGIADVAEKEKAINRKITEMEEAAEEGREDRRCYLATMYNGKQYVEYLFKKYQDLRLVFAPPNAIGNYGGDIDNWMWPRHTGDFTYMRIYEAPDGSGAKYSPDNVPVKPENFLKISDTDLKAGDMTFILGFPGRTMRYRTSYSVAWNLDRNYIPTIKKYQEILNIITDLGKKDPDAKIKLADYDAGLNNTMKNYQGNVDGMLKSGFVENKKRFEKQLMDFINSKPELKTQYGDVLKNIEAQYALIEKSYAHDQALENFGNYFGGVLYNLASKAYDVAYQRAKPAEERRPNFSEKRIAESIARIQYSYLEFYEPFDKIMLVRALKQAAILPEDQRIPELDYILKGDVSIEDWVENAFAKTGLKDLEYVKALYDKTDKEIAALDDPLIDLAVRLAVPKEQKYEQTQVWNAKINELRKQYIDALYAWKGQNLYPDANGTMRFTYGKVKGYRPADAVWYEPFTTLKGVVDKNTGVEPFDNPPKLAELYKAKDFGRWIDPELKDVPVCFLNTCDITGGNSGSAVMNSKGKLIGLAFDGNYEAMTSDWLYNSTVQRTIVVDIRYILFITEKFAGANYLLKEMGL
jgi:hypothetical protein